MKTLIVFPSDIVSGHEKMAIRIFLEDPTSQALFVHAGAASFFTHYSRKTHYRSLKQFLMHLLQCRLQQGCKQVVLVTGSPYGYLIHKAIVRLLLLRLVEYTPFPELKQMQDRWHHRFVPFLNRLLVSRRILIDYWQIPFSSVKDPLVIQNIVV